MKKIFLVLAVLFLGLSAFAGSPEIYQTYTGGSTTQGWQSLSMEFVNVTAPTTSALTWYGRNIGGYASIDFYVTGVSTGSIPTTISAVPVYSNGVAVTAAQTITSGTPLTSIKSNFYKFTLQAFSATRNISMNFLIKD